MLRLDVASGDGGGAPDVGGTSDIRAPAWSGDGGSRCVGDGNGSSVDVPRARGHRRLGSHLGRNTWRPTSILLATFTVYRRYLSLYSRVGSDVFV